MGCVRITTVAEARSFRAAYLKRRRKKLEELNELLLRDLEERKKREEGALRRWEEEEEERKKKQRERELARESYSGSGYGGYDSDKVVSARSQREQGKYYSERGSYFEDVTAEMVEDLFGFEVVREFKRPGLGQHGIDLLCRDKKGQYVVVECKTSEPVPNRRVPPLAGKKGAKHPQMSRGWLEKKIEEMVSSRDDGIRRLGKELFGTSFDRIRRIVIVGDQYREEDVGRLTHEHFEVTAYEDHSDGKWAHPSEDEWERIDEYSFQHLLHEKRSGRSVRDE